MPGDVIVFSSHPIPGNEKAVSHVINELSDIGATVLFQDTHVSGHACQEDIKLIYALVQPKYAIPVHGERLHLRAHAELVESLGIPKKNIALLHSGDVLEVSEKKLKITGKVESGRILVDGLGVGDVGSTVIRDRQKLSEEGVVVVTLTMEGKTSQVIAGPDIVTRGFVYVKESEDLIEDATEVVRSTLWRCEKQKISDRKKLSSQIRDDLSDFIWEKTQRSPMILPIISEA